MNWKFLLNFLITSSLSLLSIIFASNAFALLIVSEDNETDVGESFRLWDHLSIDLSATYTGGFIERDIRIGAIGFNYEFLDGDLRFFSRLQGSSVKLSADLSLTEEALANKTRGDEYLQNFPNTINIRAKERDEPDLELGFTLETSDHWKASGGVFTPVLGQYSAFSPVSIVLPISSEFLGFGFSKTDLFVPQLGAQVFVYPNPKLELSYYRSDDVTFDPIYYRLVAETISADSDSSISSGTAKRILGTEPGEFLRAVWADDWGEAGLTIYQGPSSFEFTLGDTIQCLTFPLVDSEKEDVLANSETCPDDITTLQSDDAIFLYRDYTQTASLPRVKGLGLEFSYNSGGTVTWIAEYLYLDTTYAVWEVEDGQIVTPAQVSLPNSEVLPEVALFTDNNGVLDFPYTFQIFAAGLEYTSRDTDTTFSFQLFGFEQKYAEKYNRVVTSLTDDEDGEPILQDFVFPTVLFAHNLEIFNKPATLTSGLGFFGGFAGIFANTSIELDEHYSLLTGLSGTVSISDGAILGALIPEEYEIDSDAGLGLVIGLTVTY